jgi:hypothetical protein
MTQNPNNPQYTPDVPQWIAGSQQPPAGQHPGAQQAVAQHAGATAPAAGATAPLPGGAIGGQPAGNTQGAPVTGKGRWRSSDGKPTGLALAGAGSLLAVLAFLGGTAVGHAWGGTAGTDQTQFGGPGGGRFRQLPGQTQGGTGQGGTGTVPGQGNQQGQGTVPGQGTDPNQVPSTQPSTGTQDSGQQQLPGQTQSNGQTRTT